MKKGVSVAVVMSFCVSALMADSTVEQKTKFRMGGALGGVVNMMGGGATREGVVSTTTIKGNRRLRKTGDSGELTDLNEEKVYSINFKDGSYKVLTFAEMRKQMEEMKAQGAKNRKEAKEAKKDGEKTPELDVVVDVNQTGEKETINGYATRRSIVTVTATEKGMKLKDSGGLVLTADMWLGPKLPAVREEADYQMRFVQKAYGSAFEADMRQMAMVLGSAPAFGKAMKKLEEKKGALDGSPIRSELRFETVADPREPAADKEQESSNEPSAAAMKMVGGLLGRMKKRDAEAKKEEAPKPSEPGRSMLFTSTTEVLKAEGTATAEAVALPMGFKLRK